MVNVDTTSALESFRRFLINSTCASYIPESYLYDPEVFPEKDGETGSIYIEAADKVTLKKERDITFINVRDVLGIIYKSKGGKVTGEASTNSLVNLITAKVIDQDYAVELANIENVDNDSNNEVEEIESN